MGETQRNNKSKAQGVDRAQSSLGSGGGLVLRGCGLETGESQRGEPFAYVA